MAEPFIQQNNKLLFIQTWMKQNPDVIAGFSTKNGGVSSSHFTSLNVGLHVFDDDQDVLKNREIVAKELQFSLDTWVTANQIHSNKIVKANKSSLGKGAYSYQDSIIGTDGLYTYEKNLLLVLCYADCVPLYFYSPKNKIVGIAHAGWKGTVQNIGFEMVSTWVNDENINSSDIYVAIGPSIGPCCYIVDDHVINEVERVLDNQNSVKPYQLVSDNQYKLDLQKLNYLLLINAGIIPDKISVSSYCTSCESHLFFSHRRDMGKSGRMMAFVGLKEE